MGDLFYISIFIGIMFLLLIYEFVVRNIPTRRNLSLVDLFKRLMDWAFPNYHKDDFPLRKHK